MGKTDEQIASFLQTQSTVNVEKSVAWSIQKTLSHWVPRRRNLLQKAKSTIFVGTITLLLTGSLHAEIYQDANGVWRQRSSMADRQPPPKTSTGAQRSKTAQVTLEDAVIFQEGPKPDSSFVSFTLRGKWINNNPVKVTVYYKVYFYDASHTVLYVDSRFREIDTSTATMAPQVLATFRGEPTDDFDYNAVATTVIKYHIDGDATEKIYKDVPLRSYE